MCTYNLLVRVDWMLSKSKCQTGYILFLTSFGMGELVTEKILDFQL